MKKLALPALLALTLLSGCSKSTDSAYLGSWVNDQETGFKLEIVKNGDQYLVKETKLYGSGPQTRSYPAVIKDGMVQVANGIGFTSLVIDRSTGKLHYANRVLQLEK